MDGLTLIIFIILMTVSAVVERLRSSTTNLGLRDRIPELENLFNCIFLCFTLKL